MAHRVEYSTDGKHLDAEIREGKPPVTPLPQEQWKCEDCAQVVMTTSGAPAWKSSYHHKHVWAKVAPLPQAFDARCVLAATICDRVIAGVKLGVPPSEMIRTVADLLVAPPPQEQPQEQP